MKPRYNSIFGWATGSGVILTRNQYNINHIVTGKRAERGSSKKWPTFRQKLVKSHNRFFTAIIFSFQHNYISKYLYAILYIFYSLRSRMVYSKMISPQNTNCIHTYRVLNHKFTGNSSSLFVFVRNKKLPVP